MPTTVSVNTTGVPIWSDKPTMLQLLRFPSWSGSIIKITERIATKNMKLGHMLLEDDTGAATENIVAQFKHDPPTRGTEAIFQRWLQGAGRMPLSWTTLVDALREIPALSKLVQELEEHFGKSIII